MADPVPTTSGVTKSGAPIKTYNFSTTKYRPPTTPLQQRYTSNAPTMPAERSVWWSDEQGTENYIPTTDAYNLYALMGTDARAKMFKTMDAFYGKGVWNEGWVPKFWGRAVNVASTALTLQNRKLNPLDAFDMLVRDAAAAGVGPDGAGSGGGKGGGKAALPTVNLTDPGTARTIVNQALQGYLGRKALPDEEEKFMAALRRQEMKNPSKVTVKNGMAVQSGGFNPQAFAEDFAQAQEGSAEYAAATTLLDSFISSLANPVELT